MVAKRLIILILFLFVLFLGDWGKRELNELGIVTSGIYDYKEGKVKITTEVINPAAIGSNSKAANPVKPAYFIIAPEGNSPAEAFRNSTFTFDRKLFFSQAKVRFISEAFAKSGISPLLDLTMRLHEFRQTSFIVVIKGDNPGDIYKATTGFSDSVGDYVNSLSKAQPNTTSQSVFTQTLDFVKNYYAEGIEPVAGVIEKVSTEPQDTLINPDKAGGKEKYKLKYGGLAVFKEDKFIGFLGDIDTRSYNFIANKFDSAFINVETNNNKTILEITTSKCDMKVDFKNNQVTVDLKIKAKGNVVNEDGNLNVDKETELQKIQTEYSKIISDQISSVINKVQKEYNSDIFGFGKSLHISNPKIYKKIKNKWDDYFKNAKVNVSVHLDVVRTGEIKEPANKK